MPTRWLILAALLTGLVILVSGAIFFVLAAQDNTAAGTLPTPGHLSMGIFHSATLLTSPPLTFS